MVQDDTQLPVALPEDLRRQFDNVEHRLWRLETTVAICAVIGGLGASWLALFISDRFWATPVWLRCLFLGLGVTTGVVAILHWLRHWVFHRRDLRDLAKLVQKTYRRLGDRLLGIVELANEQRHSQNFSPELYHAAIAQVAQEAAQYDFRASVSSRPARKVGTAVVMLLAILGATGLVLPQAMGNAFARWLQPGATILRYTLVDIEGLPAQMIVAHGEPFNVVGAVQYKAFWKPGHVLGQIGKQPKIRSQIQASAISIPVPARAAVSQVEQVRPAAPMS